MLLRAFDLCRGRPMKEWFVPGAGFDVGPEAAATRSPTSKLAVPRASYGRFHQVQHLMRLHLALGPRRGPMVNANPHNALLLKSPATRLHKFDEDDTDVGRQLFSSREL